MAGFDILSIVGDEWNDSQSIFGGIKVAITDTASYNTSKFLEFMLNGVSRYRVLKTGETIVSNATGSSIGGMVMRGAQGEMALTSQIDSATGAPADVVRWYWEGANQVGSHPDSVAVIRGMGNNRFSIESGGAITHIARNSRYEWEGYISPRIIFTGYQAASAIGKTIDFLNAGQTPTRANPVVSISVVNATDDPLHICNYNGTSWTTVARFTGSGALQTPSVTALGPAGIARGFAAQVTGESYVRFFMGMTGNNTAFMALGPGNGPLDCSIFRAGTDMVGLGGTTAGYPALKRFSSTLQARLADDRGFCHVQGMLTTDAPAASGTVTPTMTLTLYDATGTAYRVPCAPA